MRLLVLVVTIGLISSGYFLYEWFVRDPEVIRAFSSMYRSDNLDAFCKDNSRYILLLTVEDESIALSLNRTEIPGSWVGTLALEEYKRSEHGYEKVLRESYLARLVNNELLIYSSGIKNTNSDVLFFKKFNISGFEVAKAFEDSLDFPHSIVKGMYDKELMEEYMLLFYGSIISRFSGFDKKEAYLLAANELYAARFTDDHTIGQSSHRLVFAFGEAGSDVMYREFPESYMELSELCMSGLETTEREAE